MYELSLTSSRSFGSVGLPFDETILETCPVQKRICREMASFGKKLAAGVAGMGDLHTTASQSTYIVSATQ